MRIRQLPWFAAAFALLATCSTDAQFVCEEAAAHLRDCCPGFDPTALRCDDVGIATGGCNGIAANGVREAEAKCMLGLECSALPSVCSRVKLRAACLGPLCADDSDCVDSCPIFQPRSACRDTCSEAVCTCASDASSDCDPSGAPPPCPIATQPVCP